MSFYVTSGTMGHLAPSYIVRATDELIFCQLLKGEYCYVLSIRQIGKSSLMIQTRARLRAEDVAVVSIDLTLLGRNLTPDQWYNGMLSQLGRELDCEQETEDYIISHLTMAPLQRWIGLLRDVVLPNIQKPVVIFIDEIDFVRSLPFSANEFFAAIRACHNARASDETFHRLTFCLLGVATPSDLIEDVNLTPFNIGERVQLEDFTPKEAETLATGLGFPPETSKRLISRILYWTNGHPCLTQRLCKTVADNAREGTFQEVDACCERLFFSSGSSRGEEKEDNLASVGRRLTGGTPDEVAALLPLFESVCRGKHVQDDETQPLIARLKLTGAVKADNRRLVVRNRIYARVFSINWIREHLPDAERRRQRIAFQRGVLRAVTISGCIIAIVVGLAITALQQAHRATLFAQEALALVYLTDMNLLPFAYEHNDFRLMHQLLQETSDNPNRGIEWFYWQQKTHPERLTLQGHTEPVTQIVFSPFQNQLITSAEDGSICVWNGKDGRLLHRHLTGAFLFYFALSPDGRTILPAIKGGSGKLLDASTGEVNSPLYGPFERQILKYLDRTATGPELARVRFPNIPGEWLVPQENDLHYTAMSAEGRYRIYTVNARTRGVMDTRTQRCVALLAHPDTTYKCLFSPDQRWIVTCSRDHTARLWNLEGKQIRSFTGHQDAVRNLAFSPDSRYIATAGADRQVILWELETGRRILTLRGHEDAVSTVSFSPDGRTLATGGREGSIRLWDITLNSISQPIQAHRRGVNSAIFSHSGDRWISCSEDGSVKIWSTQTGQLIRTLYTAHSSVNTVEFSRDDRLILTAGEEGCVEVWDAETGMTRHIICPATPGGYASFCADSNYIVVGGKGEIGSLYDLRSGKIVRQFVGHTDDWNNLAVSPDGTLLASASGDNTARIWDLNSGRLLRTLTGHTDRVYTVAFSPDSKRLVTGSRDQTARIWNVATGKAIMSLTGQDGRVYSAMFTSDGRRVLTESGLLAKLWDTTSGRQLLKLDGHKQEILSVSISPDSQHILTADKAGMIRHWYIPMTDHPHF